MKYAINNVELYALTFSAALVISFFLTPVLRLLAVKLNILDHPFSKVKTHVNPTPYLGGLAIWIGWALSLFIIRFFTHFPTGTLGNLRGVLIGSAVVLALGLWDDIVPKGIGFKRKFLIQILAALIVTYFGIRLHFVSPGFMALAMSVLWVVGITNAMNIIDIMDGLSGGIAVIASLAFLFISLPSEAIYVNFCAAALAGGVLGFLPFNFSKNRKIFMGDTGSMSIGFILAALAMGTSYTQINNVGLFAPLLILAIPIYDTFLVIFFRWRKGQSPFLGSKDHFALRLEKLGNSRPKIITITYTISILLSFAAFLFTRLDLIWSSILLAVVLVFAFTASYQLGKVKID
jgi:UDP-GlcNAc:undecaprenyl-phosphate/decaprenyl-phosphate GlcNAc-1-phosphate transferase